MQPDGLTRQRSHSPVVHHKNTDYCCWVAMLLVAFQFVDSTVLWTIAGLSKLISCYLLASLKSLSGCIARARWCMVP